MGSLSSFALGLISAAILSRYFVKSEYGTYRQILYVYNTLLVIFTAGLPRVFAYFLPRYNLEQGKDIVVKVSKVLFLLGLIFSGFLFTFSGLIANILKNPELSRGLKYFSPIPALLLPTLGIEGIFSTYKKTIFIAIYNILTRFLMLLFIVLPVILLKGTYLYAIYGWIIVSLITLGLASIFKSIPFKNIALKKSNLTIQEILKYSLPLVSASIAGLAISASDQFFISRYFGAAVFAEFANGFIEIPFVHMITGSTSTVLMPVFSRMIYNKSDSNQIVKLWQSALQKSVIMIYPMVIFFMFYSKETMIILFSEAYSGAAKYFATAMTLNFFNVIIFAPLLIALGEVRYYARVHQVLAIITWLSKYLVLVIFFTPMSIAILSVFLSICKILFLLKYSANKIGVKFIQLFPIGRLIVISLHSFISLAIVNLLLKYFFAEISGILFIGAAGIGFIILLFSLSKLFKIEYWHIILPLFQSK